MADDDEPTTNDQKIAIATYFIMSTPVGEVDFVVADTQKLIDDAEVLTQTKLTGILQDYNIEHRTTAKTPSGHGCCVSSFGMVSANEYLDPKSGDVLVFDHVRREFTGTSEKKVSCPTEHSALRKAIEKEVQTYLGIKYKKGKAVATVYVDAVNNHYNVVITAVNTKISAFWTGGWNSTFLIDMNAKEKEVAGEVKLHVHYFEDGNVQLHSALNRKIKIVPGDDATTAEQIRQAIEQIEDDYQGELEKMYVRMHKQTFKAMRRFLPITKQPMEWNINAHGVGLK